VARRCKGCGRLPSAEPDAECCPVCAPNVRRLQSRRAARRDAELRVTARWGSQDSKRIARECHIDMSGPKDRWTAPPERPEPKPGEPGKPCKRRKNRKKRRAATRVILTGFESNRRRH
jgi:hypothetical protein